MILCINYRYLFYIFYTFIYSIFFTLFFRLAEVFKSALPEIDELPVKRLMMDYEEGFHHSISDKEKSYIFKGTVHEIFKLWFFHN